MSITQSFVVRNSNALDPIILCKEPTRHKFMGFIYYDVMNARAVHAMGFVKAGSIVVVLGGTTILMVALVWKNVAKEFKVQTMLMFVLVKKGKDIDKVVDAKMDELEKIEKNKATQTAN